MVQQKRPKKTKRPDTRPARGRYWNTGRMATRKVRNLIDSGYSLDDALRVWEGSRKRYQGAGPNYAWLKKYVNRNA